MNRVGPDTPIGTLCIFIGRTKSYPERIGTTMRIEQHIVPGSNEQLATRIRFGYAADVVVRALSDGALAVTKYEALVLIDDGDPDAEQRDTETPEDHAHRENQLLEATS